MTEKRGLNMPNYNISHDQYKNHYGSSYYLPQRIGPGALGNDQVRRCYKCGDPIQFRKRPDGTYQLLDYFTGQQHVHRQPRREQID